MSMNINWQEPIGAAAEQVIAAERASEFRMSDSVFQSTPRAERQVNLSDPLAPSSTLRPPLSVRPCWASRLPLDRELISVL